MKTTFYRWVLLLLLPISGDLLAQFKTPPPDARAPVCSERKAGSPECKRLSLPADVTLSCVYRQVTDTFGGMECTASVWTYSNGEWQFIEPSLLKYYWASIVDGEEYHSAPMDSEYAFVFCGESRQGYVRVSAAGGTAIASFVCDGGSSPGGQ